MRGYPVEARLYQVGFICFMLGFTLYAALSGQWFHVALNLTGILVIVWLLRVGLRAR